MVLGGGYTMRNVALCWCYETAVVVGVEPDTRHTMNITSTLDQITLFMSRRTAWRILILLEIWRGSGTCYWNSVQEFHMHLVFPFRLHHRSLKLQKMQRRRWRKEKSHVFGVVSITSLGLKKIIGFIGDGWLVNLQQMKMLRRGKRR
ncbi:hypothetical protein MLD38_021875 [Melastoma candidum]|uniref:Uncharacterized protein n=1 Tax=Melastoma candidum TaxID=119954 RepID=A0ACB9QHA7_9MYRT|nr:hypothetical protein MLD38_021875 [Melastoma candidum]